MERNGRRGGVGGRGGRGYVAPLGNVRENGITGATSTQYLQQKCMMIAYYQY